MSAPAEQRAVAALLGATAVWRALGGVAAIVRWLWLGSVVSNASMSLLLVAVLVGPIVGAVAGDAALRGGFWSRDRRAHRRRGAAVGCLLVVPFVVTRLVGLGRPASLPLYGAVTVCVTTVVLLATFGRSGGDE